jgi:hypothetical protein
MLASAANIGEKQGGFANSPLFNAATLREIASEDNPNVGITVVQCTEIQPTMYKISVLGEVNKPNSYKIASERVTLLEAISMAGDMTIYGKRSNILVIREVDGKKTFNRVDLTNKDFISSPFYYLNQKLSKVHAPKACLLFLCSDFFQKNFSILLIII